jgi:predicted dehydrogenase
LTQTPAPLRVAVMGLGFMGSTHLKALWRMQGVQVAAVFDADAARLDGDFTAIRGNTGGPGEKLDFTHVAKYQQADALLADPAIDAVDLCLPTDLHASVALAALNAGKHVLVEKPMALSGAEASELVEVASRHGRVLMAAHVLRFWPEYVALRDAVRSGVHGPLRSVELRRRCAAPGWGGWLQDPARSGGAILDLMIHDADMCLHLLGMPATVRATGYAGASVNQIDATLEWNNGARAQVSGGWQHPGDFPFSMEFTATFERAALDYSSAGRPLTWYPSEGAADIVALPATDAYEAELRYFVECCHGGQAPELCPPAESAAAVHLIERMLESRSRKGERVSC